MLLKRYKDKFSGNPLGATWGYLRQIARDALPPNPLVSHDTQPAHLRDSNFLVETLRWMPSCLYCSGRMQLTCARVCLLHGFRVLQVQAPRVQ